MDYLPMHEFRKCLSGDHLWFGDKYDFDPFLTPIERVPQSPELWNNTYEGIRRKYFSTSVSVSAGRISPTTAMIVLFGEWGLVKW